MKLFRNNQILLSDKVNFYANILRKALVEGTDASITNDAFIEAELTDKWENEYPELPAAWEENNKLRQAHRKAYEQSEAEILGKITPVPGGKQTPTAS